MNESQSQRRQEVKAELRAHLETNPQINPSVVLARYPDVPSRTFSRWLREVRDEMAKAQVTVSGSDVVVVDGISDHRAIERSDPVGERALQTYSWMARIGQAYEDAEALRRFACGQALPDDPKIRNPAIFDLSIRRRLEVVSYGLRTAEVIRDRRYNADNRRPHFELAAETLRP